MTERHELREAGQVCLGMAHVETADVIADADHGNVLELTLSTTGPVPGPVAKALAVRGLGIDVGRSGTKPDHTIVVAY